MNDLTEKYVNIKSGYNPNLRFLENEIGNYRILAMPGGTRSGKTYSAGQFIWRNLDRYSGVNYSIVRQTLTSLKATVLRDFIDIGTDAGLYREAYHNKSANEYSYNGNLLDYFGADDDEKIRGRKRHVLYMNEGPEMDWSVVQQLLWRTEAKVIIDYNPSYPESWVYDNILTRKDCAFITTTYQNNPYLTSGQLDEIEWMRENDPDTYIVYGLGQRGNLKGQIYKHWKRIKALPAELASSWIIDFGFSNSQTCVTEAKYDGKRAVFAKEHLYKLGLDNFQLAICLFFIGVTANDEIIADGAEPKSIAEMRRGWGMEKDWIKQTAENLGFTADDPTLDKLQKALRKGFPRTVAALKGQDSVLAGIQKVKQYEVFVTEDSINAWREFGMYRWEEDSKTGILTNEPIKKNDHFCDTLRYFTRKLY